MLYVIEVENVKCNGCVTTIQNALREIDGVKSVEVEVTNGQVSVETDSALLSRDTLSVILTALGYPPK